jgi:hypothetical protein
MHLHTYYSFLDGHGSPEKRVKKAKELGMTAIAITDHNHVGGVIDFQNACKKENIKPILGCEMYFTEDTGILSKTSEERYNLALEKARTNGVVISDRMLKKDYMVFGNSRTQVIESEGNTWKTREPAIMYFFKDKWFNIIAQLKNDGIYYYCNIATPYIIEKAILSIYKERK